MNNYYDTRQTDASSIKPERKPREAPGAAVSTTVQGASAASAPGGWRRSALVRRAPFEPQPAQTGPSLLAPLSPAAVTFTSSLQQQQAPQVAQAKNSATQTPTESGSWNGGSNKGSSGLDDESKRLLSKLDNLHRFNKSDEEFDQTLDQNRFDDRNSQKNEIKNENTADYSKGNLESYEFGGGFKHARFGRKYEANELTFSKVRSKTQSGKSALWRKSSKDKSGGDQGRKRSRSIELKEKKRRRCCRACRIGLRNAFSKLLRKMSYAMAKSGDTRGTGSDDFKDVDLHEGDEGRSGFQAFSLGADEAMSSRRVFAVRGNSLKQGPHMKFSFRWLMSVNGLEYVQLVLWLIKDWSWSQVHWLYPGVICGTLAVVVSIYLVVMSVREDVYSEAFLAMGTLLWLCANYVWMMGELLQENVLDDEDFGEELYNTSYEIAKYTTLVSVIWVNLYFWAMIPLNIFWEEQGSELVAIINHNSPPPRFRYIFRTFREYESLHLFFWSVKDMLWAWNSKWGYLVFFFPTMLLNMDLLYLFATHRDQAIDFWHYLSMFFWLFANGLWAFGELYRELPNDDAITDDQWDAYAWPTLPLPNEHFSARYAAGFFMMAAAVTLLVFYVYWICFARIKPGVYSSDIEVRESETHDVKPLPRQDRDFGAELESIAVVAPLGTYEGIESNSTDATDHHGLVHI